MQQYEDTIVAPATAPGEGGIGIIRLSGPCAEEFLQSFFRPTSGEKSLQSHRLYHGKFFGPGEHLIDEVMAVVMRAPRSYTREDVAEVHCHGGNLVVRRILDHFIEAGARLATPGEFTLRAFLKGRINLTEAEAVIEVIRSRSEKACSLALSQLDGKLSRTVYRFRDLLQEQLALIEAYIDFPEEDIELPLLRRIEEGVAGIQGEIEQILQSFDAGRILREGLSVLILGRPNVGKSSLLNALLGEARAIVTEIPGTTRDTIEENLVLGGIPLRLVDTAGVRHTEDPVEREGVKRAREKVRFADLVLLVVDGSRPLEDDDYLAIEACQGVRTIIVANKTDLGQHPLPSKVEPIPLVLTSVHCGDGLEELQRHMVEMFTSEGNGEQGESPMITDRRHRQALVHCRQALIRFFEGMSGGMGHEFLALELREALSALGEITGETTPDQILEKIFSKFCIGK